MTTGRSLRLGEMVLGGGVLALGLFIAVETAMLEVAPSHAAVGPRLFPFLVAAGLVVVGVALLREAFFGHIAHEGGFELDWRGGGARLGRAGRAAAAAREPWAGSSRPRSCSSPSPAPSAAAGCWSTPRSGSCWRASRSCVFNYGLGLSLPTGTLVERLLPADEESE